MNCCFSGQAVPTDKLFVLYYPPAMAHQDWDKSVCAAARAGEALGHLVASLRSFYWRYVVGRKLWVGGVVGLVGGLLMLFWVGAVMSEGTEGGFFRKYPLLIAALIPLLFAARRILGFVGRHRTWKAFGAQTVCDELKAIEEQIAVMPDDPSAEQAAVVMRRTCPEVLSELAFAGFPFRAFTYLDFVMYPQLAHPRKRDELPDGHSLYRDAYYVGEIVYDGWRPFQNDQRELVDPRFVGSSGRRGVI